MKKISLTSIADDFKMGLKDYSLLYKNGIPLKELLENSNYESDIKSGRTPSKFNPVFWNGDYDFITLSDVENLTYTLNEQIQEQITEDAISEYNNLVCVPAGELIISNAMTVGLAFIVDRDVYVNQNVFWVKLNTGMVNKKFIAWYFNSHIRGMFQSVYYSKYLSKKELSKIHIPNIGIDMQNSIADQISHIETDIKLHKSKIKSVLSIVDSVFQREFDFDYDTFEELKTHKTYISKQSLFSNNSDLRFSAKYHRPAGDFVMEQLTGITDKKIKHFLAEPIVLGASISPSDFDENGEAYYVSMATIKTLEVELDETQLVSQEYYESHKAKSLQKGDIIVARSGVAIGKTAIVKEEFDGIFADFTMRIRFDSARYNPMFAYYYLRSKYFQYFIDVYKKGLQNQNIFPIVMQEFPILDISIGEQQRIVDEIQAEISKQDDIKNQIAELRSQIDDIIMETFSVLRKTALKV
jgi:Restriction endonuclease S subunits